MCTLLLAYCATGTPAIGSPVRGDTGHVAGDRTANSGEDAAATAVSGMTWPFPTGGVLRVPRPLTGMPSLLARLRGSAAKPGFGLPRCPHGFGRAIAPASLGPGVCEPYVRAAACGPLLRVDVSGSESVVRNRSNAGTLRRLTTMADASCGARPPRLPPPVRAPTPPPAVQPIAAHPAVPHPAVPHPTAAPPPAPPPGAAPKVPQPPRNRPVRRVPRPVTAAAGGLPTANVIFLVMLPAAAAAVVAGSRVRSRR